MLAGFDGVDRLARDVDAERQLGLAPLALGTQHAKTVLHDMTGVFYVSGYPDYMSRFTDSVKLP